MKIALLTARYSLRGGGVAAVSRLLARGLRARKHEVVVLTTEDCSGDNDQDVISQPSSGVLVRKIVRSDAVIMQGCVLNLGWPLLFVGKRAIMVRHIFECRTSPLVKWYSKRCNLVAVSHFMASLEARPCRVLPNPYDDELFYNDGSDRDRDILFVGRLVEEKGLMLLLEAFKLLSNDGCHSLTIIGNGPQMSVAEEFVRLSELGARVNFLGHQNAPCVADQMRRHRVLVVPSIWDEPFGLVVLEGLACGCRIVAANRGGIPEALNGFGELFEAASKQDLARALRAQLSELAPVVDRQLLSSHLKKHQQFNVAKEYEILLLDE